MNKVKSVVVDSDAIFALYNPNDSLNTKATYTFQELIAQKFQLIYPTSVIFEIISLFQRVLPTPTVTSKLIDMIKNDEILIYIVDNKLLSESAGIFKPSGSKKNTLVDCSVVAVAKKIKADGVFAYDEFYTKQGLKLAEDLIVQ
jgi:predicted nucleic acid-binding protein